MNISHCGIFSQDMGKTINTEVMQRVKWGFFSRLMKQMALNLLILFPENTPVVSGPGS